MNCQQYLEDPEANAAHLAECEKCRALAETLQPSLPSSVLGPRSSVDVDRLPLAGWEGAGYRSWTFVLGGAVLVAVVAAVPLIAAGFSPLRALSNLPSVAVLMSTLRHVGAAAQNAPASWQLVVAALFIAVNAIFIALLRRAPRGIDV